MGWHTFATVGAFGFPYEDFVFFWRHFDGPGLMRAAEGTGT
jgi:hypothetical protein